MEKMRKIILGIILLVGIIFVSGCVRQTEVAQSVKMALKSSPVLMQVEIPEISETDLPVAKEEPPKEEIPADKDADNDNGDVKKDNIKKNQTTSTKKSTYPYYIRVNRLANCVTIYKQDENGAYTIPVKAMICSVGKNINKTPKGVFRTTDKYTWRYLYGNQYGQYATRITGHILFHSVPYTQQSKDTLKTDYYNNLGVGDSMGCIRLTCEDAKWIYDNCAKGTTVEIYDNSEPGPLGKPTSIKIDVNSPYAGWDPTDPDENNPWKKQEEQPVKPEDSPDVESNDTENEVEQPNVPEEDAPIIPDEGGKEPENPDEDNKEPIIPDTSDEAPEV